MICKIRNSSRAEELTKQKFCRILCADVWKYEEEPSHFFEIWEDFRNEKKREYPWDRLRYPQQVESMQFMYKYIHKLYGEIACLNVKQLEIQWN